MGQPRLPVETGADSGDFARKYARRAGVAGLLYLLAGACSLNYQPECTHECRQGSLSTSFEQ